VDTQVGLLQSRRATAATHKTKGRRNAGILLLNYYLRYCFITNIIVTLPIRPGSRPQQVDLSRLEDLKSSGVGFTWRSRLEVEFRIEK